MEPYKVSLQNQEDLNAFMVTKGNNGKYELSISETAFNEISRRYAVIYKNLGPPYGSPYMYLINKITNQQRLFGFDHTDEVNKKDVWIHLGDNFSDKLILNILL